MFRRRPAPVPDPEQERGERIVRQMQRLERPRTARRLSFVPILLALALVVAIVAVILSNRERFSVIWSHLTRPDSIPGIGR